MWEVYVGLVVLANIFGLLTIAQLFNASKEKSQTVRSIMNGMKVLFIGAALVIGAVSIGGSTHVIDASINATNTTTDQTVTQVKDFTASMYKGAIWTYIPFILLLGVSVIIAIIETMPRARNKQRTNRRGRR